jgi:NitT/TauT family transport system permease protein
MRALHRVLVAVVAALLVAVNAGFCRGTPNRVGTLRAALDALIAALRTISTLAWYPLVILLFQLAETAILLRDKVRMRFTRGRHQINR